MLWVFLAPRRPIRGRFSLWCHFTIGQSRCNRSVSRWTSSIPTKEGNTFCTTATYLLELIGNKSALNSPAFLLFPDGLNVQAFKIMNKLTTVKIVYAVIRFIKFIGKDVQREWKICKIYWPVIWWIKMGTSNTLKYLSKLFKSKMATLCINVTSSLL